MQLELTPAQMLELQQRPDLFCRAILGIQPTPYQVKIMESVRDNKYTTVASGNGLGKDFIAAATVLWWVMTRRCIVVSTAPTDRQMREVLWQQISSQFNRARVKLIGELLQTKLSIADRYFAIGMTAESEAAFQGWHSDNLLMVFSEAQGVQQSIWDAAEGCMTSKGCRMLVIGNPIGIGTAFHKTFSSSIWNKIKISAFDSPNVIKGNHDIEGLVTREWVEQRKEEWGEDNPLYQSRVLGEFPTESDDTLIGLNWILKAVDKKIELASSKLTLGGDIARYGSCESVVASFDGYRVKLPIIKQGNNTVDNAGAIINLARDNQVESYRQHELEIYIDDVGVGGGVTDILQREGYKVFGVIGNAVPSDSKFFDLRAEMYWALREAFRTDVISIPKDDKLISQLASLKYEYTTRGQIRLISKDKLKKLGQESPDRSDAVAMAVWGHRNSGIPVRGNRMKSFDKIMAGGGAGGY